MTIMDEDDLFMAQNGTLQRRAPLCNTVSTKIELPSNTNPSLTPRGLQGTFEHFLNSKRTTKGHLNPFLDSNKTIKERLNSS